MVPERVADLVPSQLLASPGDELLAAIGSPPEGWGPGTAKGTLDAQRFSVQSVELEEVHIGGNKDDRLMLRCRRART